MFVVVMMLPKTIINLNINQLYLQSCRWFICVDREWVFKDVDLHEIAIKLSKPSAEFSSEASQELSIWLYINMIGNTLLLLQQALEMCAVTILKLTNPQI